MKVIVTHSASCAYECNGSVENTHTMNIAAFNSFDEASEYVSSVVESIMDELCDDEGHIRGNVKEDYNYVPGTRKMIGYNINANCGNEKLSYICMTIATVD